MIETNKIKQQVCVITFGLVHPDKKDWLTRFKALQTHISFRKFTKPYAV